MMKARRLLPLLAFFTLACGLVVPVPTPTPLPATATQTASPTATFTTTPDLAATETIAVALTRLSYTATPSRTPTPQINPEDMLEEEQLLAPPAVSPGAAYELVEEKLVGAYGIRFWRDLDAPYSFEDILMIEKLGSPSIRIEQASAIELLTGTDINGDGFPEAIIETYTGGAHCCLGTQVYSLGEQPKLILKKPESNTGGQFEDIDNDGIYEFITYDDLFAYQYCPYAGSPFVKSILVYDPVQALYQPASPLFPEEYIQDILINTEAAEKVKPGEYGEWDETSKCGVLPMVLAHIYSGDLETARSELRRVYPYPDVNAFWDEIMLQIQDSPLYVPKEAE